MGDLKLPLTRHDMNVDGDGMGIKTVAFPVVFIEGL